MQRRRRRSNPWRVLLLIVLVAGALYINQVVVPATPPLFIATSTPTRSPESFITDAENLLAQGKLSLAAQSYRQAVQADPKNPANYLALARLQIFTADYGEALTSAENALLLNPNNSMANALRGWALSFSGEYLPAEASARKAIELDPNSGVAYAILAEVLAQQTQAGTGGIGTLEKAVEASRTAMALAPNQLETHRARGIVLELTGNYDEAVSEFEAAVAINSNIADLHLALGRNYRYLERYDLAVESFNRANALNPADPMPDTLISRTYATVGEFAKAIQYAQQAVKDEPSSAYMHGNLGVMYVRNRQYAEGVTPLRLATRGGATTDGVEVDGLPLDYGRVAEYYSLYGVALARTGDCGEALQISQLLSEGVPSDEISMYNAEAIVDICKSYLGGNAPAPAETAAP